MDDKFREGLACGISAGRIGGLMIFKTHFLCWEAKCVKLNLPKLIRYPFLPALLEKPASHTPSLTPSPNGGPVPSVWKSQLDLVWLRLPPWQPSSLSLWTWPCHTLSSEEKSSCLEPMSSTSLTTALRCVHTLRPCPISKEAVTFVVWIKNQQNDWCRWLDLSLHFIDVLLILSDDRLSWLDLPS